MQAARLKWDPTQYNRFQRERAQPFFDLLARIPDRPVQTIADLGCGTGKLTAKLARRWPEARVCGMDASPEMLQMAEGIADLPNLTFERADFRKWEPENSIDLLVSNAALQWVPNHEEVLKHLVGMLGPGGVLAVQIPNSRRKPALQILADMIEKETRLGETPFSCGGYVQPVNWYAELLLKSGFTVEAWETTYMHRLNNPSDIVEWLKGTALGYILNSLAEDEAAEFLSVFRTRIETSYPVGSFGTWFPFRRLFFVGSAPE